MHVGIMRKQDAKNSAEVRTHPCLSPLLMAKLMDLMPSCWRFLAYWIAKKFSALKSSSIEHVIAWQLSATSSICIFCSRRRWLSLFSKAILSPAFQPATAAVPNPFMCCASPISVVACLWFFSMPMFSPALSFHILRTS